MVAFPIAAAVPVAASTMLPTTPNTDRRALEAYASWLFMERRILCGELWPHMGAMAEHYDWFDNAGAGWHFRGDGEWRDLPQPSSRAAAVLDLVGVDWRQPKEDLGLNHDDTGERPALPARWPEVDGELRQAIEDLKAHYLAIWDIHKAHGDDADSREDYLDLTQSRDDCLQTLIGVKASSMVGILAKATALDQDDLVGDYERHQEVALSLAYDLIRLNPA